MFKGTDLENDPEIMQKALFIFKDYMLLLNTATRQFLGHQSATREATKDEKAIAAMDKAIKATSLQWCSILEEAVEWVDAKMGVVQKYLEHSLVPTTKAEDMTVQQKKLTLPKMTPD